MSFMSVVSNVLLGADLVDGSRPRREFGPAAGAFAFVDPLVVPFGPKGAKGPTFPGRTFPPVMFPEG